MIRNVKMHTNPKWEVSEAERDVLIDALTPELATLRSKAGISQAELASLIGVSRQTYGSIERKLRRMSWSTYLTLIMFFDYNRNTHHILRATGAFPVELIRKINDGMDMENSDVTSFLKTGTQGVWDALDEQALHSIRTLVMLEYARCTNTPGEVVIKSFDGKDFLPIQKVDPEPAKALKSVRKRRSSNDK